MILFLTTNMAAVTSRAARNWGITNIEICIIFHNLRNLNFKLYSDFLDTFSFTYSSKSSLYSSRDIYMYLVKSN